MAVEIWEYELQPFGNYVMIPDHCRVLSAAFHGEKLMVWAVVVPSNEKRKRGFSVVGTGWSCDGHAIGDFVGTAFHPDGLVFHVFDHGFEKSPTPTEI